MFTTKNRDTKIKELRKQLEAAEAEQKKAQKAEEQVIRRAQKAAGDNHTRLALSLYELLDVEPEHSTTRIVDGRKTTVAVDKDESLRTERLYTMVEAMLEALDPSALEKIQRADRKGRDDRRPETKKASPKAQPDKQEVQSSTESTSSADPMPTTKEHEAGVA